MKNVALIVPGLTDEPHPLLRGKTPLEAASTPNLNQLSNESEMYALQPLMEGGYEQALASWLTGMSIHPVISSSVLEMKYYDYPMHSDQLAARFRFASTCAGILVDHSLDLLSKEEAEELFRLFRDEFSGTDFRFYPLDNQEGVITFPKALLSHIEPFSCTLKAMLGKNVYDLLPSKNLKPLLEKIERLLKNHEINFLKEDFEELIVNSIVLYDITNYPSINYQPPVESLFYSRNPSSQGLAKLLDVSFFSLPSDQVEEEYTWLLEQLPYFLENNELCILELNSILDSTLKGDVLEKTKRIEWWDKHFIKLLYAFCKKEEVQLSISSLVHTKLSSSETIACPVPFLIYHPKVVQKNIGSLSSFSEKSIQTIGAPISIEDVMEQILMRVVV